MACCTYENCEDNRFAPEIPNNYHFLEDKVVPKGFKDFEKFLITADAMAKVTPQCGDHLRFKVFMQRNFTPTFYGLSVKLT